MLPLVALLPWIAAGQGQRGRLLQEAQAALCLEGKLVPELYLVGAQKAATTTLAKKLQLAGVGEACSKKECHFFDRMWGKSFREEFLRRMPACPAEPAGVRRSMVGDFTPGYLRLIPLPPGAHDKTAPEAHDIVTRMSSLYGVQAPRLHFIVMLREPLDRMHSAFRGSNGSVCRDCQRPVLRTEGQEKGKKDRKSRKPSFQEAMVRALEKARASPPVIEDWLWASLYGQQLGTWLRHFDAGQFYILPFKHMIARSDLVCLEMRRWLNFDLNCSVFTPAIHGNRGQHFQPLEKVISPEVREDFNAYMKAEKEILLQLLNSTGSLHLGLHTGFKGGSLEQWLDMGW